MKQSSTLLSPADDSSTRPHPPSLDVAVIGAGASGLLAVIHLGRLASLRGERIRVALIDPSPPQYVGLAYSTPHAEHLMNVPACRLSAFDDEPDHFVEWLWGHGCPVPPDGYAPRMLYGRYLQAVTDATIAAGGVDVRRIQDRCTSVERSERALTATVHLEGGDALDVDQVVLALGNARPVPLAGPVGPGIAAPVIDDPWDDERLRLIGPDDDVVIVGTGLTAVDLLLALDSRAHRGRTTLVSRHGRWPAAHPSSSQASHRTCIEPAEWFQSPGFGRTPTARSIVATVRLALRQRGDHDWRTVLDQIRPHTVALWRSLDDTERSRFLRHARPLWEAHRHRIAPAIAERLSSMLTDSRVTTVAGRVESIVANSGGTTVHIARADGSTTIDSRWVINCTGPSPDITRRVDPLVQSLLSQGHASPGWRGWGFDVDECGRLRRCSELGRVAISAIGPLRLGADYETTAIPEIRAQAAELALRLVDQPTRANVA